MIWIIILLLAVLSYKSENSKDEIIGTLIRQAARWSTAAAQDENPMVAVLHANYGAGYLWALKDIATDDEIKQASGIDVLRFKKEVVEAQDIATLKMIKVCPKFAPVRTYLTSLSGEGL